MTKATNIEEYIQGFPEAAQKILEQLRESKGWSKTEVARRLGIKTV